MCALETKIDALETDIRKLYFAMKDEPDTQLVASYQERLRDLADKLQFTAFSAGFFQLSGNAPCTEKVVFDAV